MSYFYGRDFKLIEALAYNPELQSTYDVTKDALVWDDERPDGLSIDGYEKLCELWIARSFIHQKISFSSWKVDPILKKFGMMLQDKDLIGLGLIELN